jgi:O-antigen/teichoic acid export membrane protein
MIKNQLIKNFLTYSGGGIFIRGFSLLLTPLYMRVLTPDDYGLLSLSHNIISVLVIILGFGLRQVFWMEYFHHNSQGRRIIVNEIIIIYAALSLPVFIALFFSLSGLNQIAFLNNANNSIIITCLLICFFNFFIELFNQVIMYQSRALKLTSLQVCSEFLTIFLNLVFIFILKLGVLGILLGTLLGQSVNIIMGGADYIRSSSLKFFNVKSSLQKTKGYLISGFPFVFSGLSAWLLSSGNRWLLAKLSDLQDLGIYSIADTFGQLFNLIIIIPLGNAYYPILINKFANNNLPGVEKWNMRNMIICMSAAVIIIPIGLILIKPFIYWIFPTDYHKSLNYAWIILFGYIFLMGTSFSLGYAQYLKKTYFLSLSILLPALFNITLNFILIPRFKGYGCALATLLSYMLYFTLTLLYNRLLIRKACLNKNLSSP